MSRPVNVFLGVAVGCVVGAVAMAAMQSTKQAPPVEEKVEEAAFDRKEKLIDGKVVSKSITDELKAKVSDMRETHDCVPGLAVVLVGERPDSAQYVRMKKEKVSEIGFHSVDLNLPDTISQEELIVEVKKLNANPMIHGILVQLPLPEGIDTNEVLKAIAVEKDADGFHALNVGNMWLSGGDPPLAVACTPAGCIELLQRYNITVSGKNCVVLGRSNIVGMPICALLQSMNGTVTCCHSRTKDTAEKCRNADIIIAAVGKAEYVRGDWIKTGAVVIDVGINRVENKDPTVVTKSGKMKKYVMKGDVNFDECAPKCSFITPVPGGVGPMTIAMLCKNTYNLALHSLGRPREPLRKCPSHVNIGARS